MSTLCPPPGRFPIEESLNTISLRELFSPKSWNLKITSSDSSFLISLFAQCRVWTVACFVLDAKMDMSHISGRVCSALLPTIFGQSLILACQSRCLLKEPHALLLWWGPQQWVVDFLCTYLTVLVFHPPGNDPPFYCSWNLCSSCPTWKAEPPQIKSSTWDTRTPITLQESSSQ